MSGVLHQGTVGEEHQIITGESETALAVGVAELQTRGEGLSVLVGGLDVGDSRPGAEPHAMALQPDVYRLGHRVVLIVLVVQDPVQVRGVDLGVAQQVAPAFDQRVIRPKRVHAGPDVPKCRLAEELRGKPVGQGLVLQLLLGREPQLDHPASILIRHKLVARGIPLPPVCHQSELGVDGLLHVRLVGLVEDRHARARHRGNLGAQIP